MIAWMIFDTLTDTNIDNIIVPSDKTNIEQIQYVQEIVLTKNYRYSRVCCICTSVFRGEISRFDIDL